MSTGERVLDDAGSASGAASVPRSPRPLRRGRRLLSCVLGAGGLAMGLLVASPGLASADTIHVCSGTDGTPGVLTGTYPQSTEIVVQGWCAVDAGQAKVEGTVTLQPNSVLLAAFARNDATGEGTSGLSVVGNVFVKSGATLLLGCEAAHFACIDDPNPNAPTLSSADSIGGNLVETDPLGVVVHKTTIGGAVNETGGGGGLSCTPTGPFAKFGSPVYSDYEDTTIGQALNISDLTSCWLGVARVHIHGNATFKDDQLADPDAIEILDNHVGENLACYDNSMVWDSADLTNDLYPRQPEPNTVGGQRLGQCVLASAPTQGGQSGPGPF
jgi:hypothetical protein